MQTLVSIDGERWLPVPGYHGYSVSDHGRISRQGLSKTTELCGKVDRTGYRQVGLIRGGKQHWLMVHRLVACTFLDQTQLTTTPDRFLTVNHKDRNKLNNRLDNLELCSVAQNHQHWRRHTLQSMAQAA